MPAPEEVLQLGSCRLLLMGTIPGFVPDGDRVANAIKSHGSDIIALGVPPEDLEALESLAADPSLADGLEPDELDAYMLAELEHWGATQSVPSPDLQAAHATGVPLVGVDLTDAQHSDRFTELVKMRHLVQRQSARKKAMKVGADGWPDPYELTAAWDAKLRAVAPLATLEDEREAAMAAGIQSATEGKAAVVAVVHSARFAGVLSRLQSQGQALS